jgi:DNA-binding winged helix-turn-helix (wHTH) protein/cytochrome c-type biogenesis protein CcmH/NrfG
MRGASPRQVLRFDAFTLDLSRCALLRGGIDVPLRRQAFDMLRYFAEHPGVLVTKEELVEAIWHKVAVSDDSLVRCVRDIREALGDREHRIIETVRGRGYVFAADVVATGSGPTPAPITQQDPFLSPPAPSLLEAVRLHLSPARRLGLALIAAAGVSAAAGMWWPRTPVVASGAAHYTILGRNVLAAERSATANQKALALFAKALDADPDWVPALLGYADVLVIQVGGKWVPFEERPARLDQAEAATERALKLEPGNAHAHHLKGVVLRMRGDPGRAVAAFERSLALNPDSAWTRAEFGRTKIDLGRADEALADIELALRMNPSETAVRVWYCWAGMAALQAGRDHEAVRWLLKARAAGPSYPLPVPFLAVAYAATGREAEGRALIADHLARARGLTMQTWRRDYPGYNPVVARQRERIADILGSIGVPDGPLRTGSTP